MMRFSKLIPQGSRNTGLALLLLVSITLPASARHKKFPAYGQADPPDGSPNRLGLWP